MIIINATVSIYFATVVTGKAGSSKTFLCCNVALDLLFTKQIEKIVIMRPMVSTEDIGHLPGDINDKMQPWMTPIIENMYDLYEIFNIMS